jgi:hypothetical protein
MGVIGRMTVSLVVLLALLTPAMTCAIPGSPMTAAEHSCCRLMKGKCGSTHMPASHGCCQTKADSNHPNLVLPEASKISSHLAPAALLQRVSSTTLSAFTHLSISQAEYSPPHFASLPSVLRI